jgi:hypothetical protein
MEIKHKHSTNASSAAEVTNGFAMRCERALYLVGELEGKEALRRFERASPKIEYQQANNFAMNFSILSLAVLSTLLLSSSSETKFDGPFKFSKMNLQKK